jgi:small-conductance mechanosensitive channel
MARKVLLTLIGKVIIVLFLLIMWWTHPYSELSPNYARFLFNLFGFLLFATGLNLAISLLMIIYRIRKGMRYNSQDNITTGVQNIYVLIIALAVIVFMLSLWGVELKTLFTSLSIVAAAIAIVSKDFIASIIAGFVIVFSRQIAIGDYVKIGEQKGKVVDITLTKLALLNEDEELVFISNEKAYHSEVINYTSGEVKRVSIPFELKSNFEGTVEELEEDLIQTLDIYKDQINPKSFNLRIVDIKKDAISFKFQYSLDKINRVLEKEIKRKTARRVLNYIKTKADGGGVEGSTDSD